MNKRTTITAISCFLLAIILVMSGCNLDAGQGIFSAISESEPTIDTTNQHILGFYGDKAYVKSQDGIYAYGTKNSTAEKLNLTPALMTNGFASPVGDASSATDFVYQGTDSKFYQVRFDSLSTSTEVSISNVRAMNNGVALTGGKDSYEAVNLGATNPTDPPIANLQDKGSAGIMFGFSGTHALTTMIEKTNKTDYTYSYYWNNSEVTLTGFPSDISKKFLRIQAFQPATEATEANGKYGVAIVKVANDNTNSYIFIQKTVGGALNYVGKANFYLNYYSPYSVPSARVKISGTDYMLVPYSAGLRLIDLTNLDTIKASAVESTASSYAFTSTSTDSFARGFNYNNVVDIKKLSETEYLVATVTSGVYTITLPQGSGGTWTSKGSRAEGYRPPAPTQP